MCLDLILLTKLAVPYEQLHIQTLGTSKIHSASLSACSYIHSCNVARKSKAMIIVLTMQKWLIYITCLGVGQETWAKISSHFKTALIWQLTCTGLLTIGLVQLFARPSEMCQLTQCSGYSTELRRKEKHPWVKQNHWYYLGCHLQNLYHSLYGSEGLCKDLQLPGYQQQWAGVLSAQRWSDWRPGKNHRRFLRTLFLHLLETATHTPLL